MLQPYDRLKAVEYAHRWAYFRNSVYYNFDEIGGDCTNFASQCLYAGSGVMDFTPVYGWYYAGLHNRAPAWTGVPYLYQYLTRKTKTPGPVAQETGLEALEPGDLIQLALDREEFQHTLVVVQKTQGDTPQILIATHSMDSDYRPLSSYHYRAMRCLHILGVQ